MMRKAAVLLLSCSLGASLTGAWCDYDCASNFPSRFGPNNLATDFGALPIKTHGYQSHDLTSFCDSSTVLTQSLRPQPAQAAGRSGKTTFVVVCPASESKEYGVQGSIKLVSIEPTNVTTSVIYDGELSGKGEILGFFAGFARITVVFENSVALFMQNGADFSLSWEHLSDTDSFNGIPAVTRDFVAVQSGSGIVKLDTNTGDFLSSSGDSKSSENLETESSEFALPFVLVDSRFNTFSCSRNLQSSAFTIQKITSTNEISELNLPPGATCTGMILPQKDRLLLSATLDTKLSLEDDAFLGALYEVNTETFSTIDTLQLLEEQIYDLSRIAWDDSVLGKVAYLGVALESGVGVVIDAQQGLARGSFVSKDGTAVPVKNAATMTGSAEPVLITNHDLVAGAVKFFMTEELNAKFKNLDLFSSPLLLGRSLMVLSTKSGETVVLSRCTRYTIGDEIPENACPAGDLPDAGEIPTWVTVAAGAGSVFMLPMLSQTLCRKMKLTEGENHGDIKLEDVNLYSDEE